MQASSFLSLFENFGTLRSDTGSTGLPPEQPVGEEDLNGYAAIYNGKTIDVWAPSLYAAKREAAQQLNVPKGREHMISLQLRVKGGEELPPEAPMF